MSFFSGFFKGINHCFKGIGLLFEKGLWPYLFYPILVWLIMWVAAIYVFAEIAQQLSAYISQQLNFENIPDSGSWLSSIKPFLTGYFSFLLLWVIKIILWWFSGTFSKYIVLILLSPLFALLSENTEEKLKNTKYPFSIMQLLKDIVRGIGISLRNMFIEYSMIIACFLITLLFSPLAFITVPFLLFVSWYFAGFTMLDYNFERHKMGIRQSTAFARNNRGLACGIGAVYSLCLLLPLFIGLMIGPVIAAIGATTAFLEIKEKEIINSN